MHILLKIVLSILSVRICELLACTQLGDVLASALLASATQTSHDFIATVNATVDTALVAIHRFIAAGISTLAGVRL